MSPSCLQAGRKVEGGEQVWIGKAGDLDDVFAACGQDHNSVGGGASPIVIADVRGYGRLEVRSRWDQGDLPEATSGRHGREELADCDAASVSSRERRHGEQGVLAEKRKKGRDIARLPCRHVFV